MNSPERSVSNVDKNTIYPTIFSTDLSYEISSKCLKYKTLSYMDATSPQQVPLCLKIDTFEEHQTITKQLQHTPWVT
jgi:hypothetical protein